MTSRLRIIVTGLIAQHPNLGGVAWDYLQYPLGLARLGHDVYYVEDSGEWPYVVDGGPRREDRMAADCRLNVTHLASVLRRFGLEDRWAYRFPRANQWFGLSDSRRAEVVASADLVINVSGTIGRPRKYRHGARLVYIDTDPVFTQVKLARGDLKFRARVFAHDVHFSFGECLSGGVPETPYDWLPTRQPVVLSEWQTARPCRDAFTTIMSWNSYASCVHNGKEYGQKNLEMARFLHLPARLPERRLEIALNRRRYVEWEKPSANLTPSPEAATVLERAGWTIANADAVAADLDSYRAYIQTSRGEWSVAKHGYVVGRPGWFSCRSACYLAAGNPVVVQDTGFRCSLPVGEGILAFGSLDEAAAAIREVVAATARHRAAARAIASEFFDSDRVLASLIERAYASTPTQAVRS